MDVEVLKTCPGIERYGYLREGVPEGREGWIYLYLVMVYVHQHYSENKVNLDAKVQPNIQPKKLKWPVHFSVHAHKY